MRIVLDPSDCFHHHDGSKLALLESDATADSVLAVSECVHYLSDDLTDVHVFKWTDFSEYTTGVQPSDWTEKLRTTSGTAIVRADGVLGGKCLEIDVIANRYFAAWDDFGDSLADVEVLAKARVAPTGYDHTPRIAVRGGGSDGNEQVAWGGFQTEQDQVVCWKYTPTSQAVGDAGEPAYTCAVNEWHWLRVRVRGTQYKVKVWPDGTNEPDTWQIFTTDTSFTSGWVGVGGYGNNADIDWFGVATGGASVPSPNLVVQSAYHVLVDDGPYFMPLDVADCYHEHTASHVDRVGTRWTDFSPATRGSWSEYWDSAFGDYGYDTTNSPQWANIALYAYSVLNHKYSVRWDTEGDEARNVEFLARVCYEGGGEHGCRLYARMSGTNAYYAQISTTENLLKVGKGTSFTLIDSHSHTISVNTWYWVRFRVENSSLKAKIWNDGAAEPATWDIEATDTDILEEGYVGFGCLESTTDASQCDYLSIALGGLTAPYVVNPGPADQKDYCDHVVTPTNLTLVQTGAVDLVMTDGGAQHVHTAENVIIDPAWVYPNDASHVVTGIDPLWWVNDCAHLHSAENIYIGIVYPEDCSHAHSATGDLVLVQTGTITLVMQDSSHVTTSDNVVIDPAWVYPNDISHVVTGRDPLWWISDSSHAISSTTPTLTQVYILAPDDSSHDVFSNNITIIWPEILQPNDSFLQPWSPEIYVQTDAVTLNWGHDTGSVAEHNGAGLACDCAFGITPNLSGKILYITAIWVFEWVGGTPDPTGTRLAIYQGDMGETAPDPASPEGYDLIKDLGQLSPSLVAGYTERTCTKTFVRKNAPTWLAMKHSSDDNWRMGWDYASPGPGDFLQGMWVSIDGPTKDKGVPWPDPWPSENGSLSDYSWMGIYAEFSVESVDQLIVNHSFHGTESGEPLPKELLVPGDCIHLHTAANVIIDPAWANTQNCVHLHQVLDNNIWWLDGCSHVLTDDGPLRFPLPVNGATHVLTSPEVSLTVHLVVAASSHVTTTAAFVLTQRHTLSPENSAHVMTDNAPITLTEWELLRVNDSSHVLTGQVDVTQLHILGLDDCIHIHAPPNVAITQDHALTIQNSSHACVSSDPSLTQDHTLIVASAASLHLVDALYLRIPLLVSDCSHITTTGAVALTQEHTLAIAGDTLAHTVPNVAMIVPITLEDCVHAVTSDSNILLTALHILAVVGITHAHVVTGLLTLFQLHFLEVAGTGRNTDYNEFIVLSDEIDFGYLPADLGGATLTIVKWVNP